MPRLSVNTEQYAPFEVCHRIPGRMRLRIPALLEDDALGPRLAKALQALEGVQATRLNPACASLVLYHRPTHPLTPDSLVQALQPILPPRIRPASPNALTVPTRTGRYPAPRTARPSVPAPQQNCILCRMKLTAARWILADVWRCWRQHFTQRLRSTLIAALLPLRP